MNSCFKKKRTKSKIGKKKWVLKEELGKSSKLMQFNGNIQIHTKNFPFVSRAKRRTVKGKSIFALWSSSESATPLKTRCDYRLLLFVHAIVAKRAETSLTANLNFNTRNNLIGFRHGHRYIECSDWLRPFQYLPLRSGYIMQNGDCCSSLSYFLTLLSSVRAQPRDLYYCHLVSYNIIICTDYHGENQLFQN